MAIQTKQDLYEKLWDGAEQLRGSMDASKYKDYMLGIMFYKFLSDKTLDAFSREAEVFDDVYNMYFEAAENDGELIYDELRTSLGYYVQPQDLYQTWVKKIEENEFEVADMQNAFSNFQRNVQDSPNRQDFDGLFSSLDVNSPDLGKDLNQRNKNLRALVKLFADLDMNELEKTDVLGDAYEYLVGQFGMESGKKAGEFYTPRQVSEVMAQIVTNSTDKIKSIYDPTVGSGSLLLTVSKHMTNDEKKVLQYVGQEYNTATYNLTRMNLLLHGVQPDHMTINNGDTLREDWPEDPDHPQQSRQFDAVVMNPPYSYNWSKGDDSAYENASLTDPRFQDYEALAPKTKADFAFLEHGLYHLDNDGAMAIVLPHGVLFRGGDEGTIRENLIKKNQIHAIVGMPAGLFTNTGIPVVVIVLKKNRINNNDNEVLIVDASKGFEKDGKQNKLREKDIAKIVDTIKYRTEETGYSDLASLNEIKENEYNLNIPRYVESIEKDEVYDVDGILHGGIPAYAIKSLSVLNNIANDTLWNDFNEIREGYLKQSVSDSELKSDIFSDENVVNLKKNLEKATDDFVDAWFEKLIKSTESDRINDIKEEMTEDAKNNLSVKDVVNGYEAYQVVANLWEKYLDRDVDMIQQAGLEKASNNGDLIPNDLIETTFFTDQTNKVNELNIEFNDVDSELKQLVDEGAENESFDGILFEDAKLLPKNKLPKKSNLIESDDAEVIEFLDKHADLTKQKQALNKEIKTVQVELNSLVEDKAASLTANDIEMLVRKKWFGTFGKNIEQLMNDALDSELAELKKLNEQYSETLTDIQQEKQLLESSFLEMVSQLVKGDTHE